MALVASIAGMNTNSYLTTTEADQYFLERYDSNSWFELSQRQKEGLLIRATHNIDIGGNYSGDKYYESQGLSFPRDDVDTVTGKCASSEITKFKNANLKSSDYMAMPANFWRYGTVHFTTATPANNICYIASSDIKGFVYPEGASFSATPTTNTTFIAFPKIDTEIKDAVCEEAFNIQSNNFDEYVEMRALGFDMVQIGDFSIRPGGGFGGSGGKIPTMCTRAKKLMTRYFRKGLRIQRA